MQLGAFIALGEAETYFAEQQEIFRTVLTDMGLASANRDGCAGGSPVGAGRRRPPLVLALVLAPLLETSLRQSLLLSFGSPAIFVERPIAAALVGVISLTVALPLPARVVARYRLRRA